MRLASPRRTTAASAVALAALGLSACGTGFNAPTNQLYQAGVGADVRDAPVQVLGALVVENPDGTGTLSASLLNTTDAVQQLTDLTVADSAGQTVDVVTEGDDLTLPIGRSVRLGAEDTKIFTLAEVEPGRYYTVTATFDGAGEVTVQLPAVARSSIYTGVVGDDPKAAAARETDAATASESDDSDSH